MLARFTSHSRSTNPSSHPRFVLFMMAAAATLGGCTEVAGLQEHLPYQGFPDSSSAPCSDGIDFRPCVDVQDKPQDGHFLTAKPNYTRSGTEILDTVTGLSWSTKTGKLQNYKSAMNHCTVMAGDYRLPTRIELASLLDFKEESTIRINTDVFDNVEPTLYWTSSHYFTDPGEYWAVDFCSTCTESPIHKHHETNSAGVLCVKGSEAPFETGRFEAAGDKNRFLSDARTGLMWMKAPLADGTKWELAGQACRDAPDGSYGDFRLPNAKELTTIVDDTRSDSAKVTTFSAFDFPEGYLWSSTPTYDAGKFFMLHIGGGSLGVAPGTETYFRAVCVRGPD